MIIKNKDMEFPANDLYTALYVGFPSAILTFVVDNFLYDSYIRSIREGHNFKIETGELYKFM